MMPIRASCPGVDLTPVTFPPFVPGRYAHWLESTVGLALPSRRPAPGRIVRVSRSVLVVDDDVTFRELVAGVLADAGYRVIGEAGSIAEALVRAAELAPDTALVDIGLPDGDGFSLALQLRSLPLPPRVVLISTDADAAAAPAVRRCGATGFLAKDALSGRTLRALIEEG